MSEYVISIKDDSKVNHVLALFKDLAYIDITKRDVPNQKANRIEEAKAFWAEFDRMAKESEGEKLDMADFPRLNLGREIVQVV